MHQDYVERYGMPESVAWGLDVLEELWPYHDGPAHVVVADFNLEDRFLKSCIWKDGDDTFSDYLPGHPIFAATNAVLEWLLAIPEAERCAWLTNYALG
jgi:hypothetical protein